MTKPIPLDDPRRVRKPLACVLCRGSKSKCDGEPPPETIYGPFILNPNLSHPPTRTRTDADTSDPERHDRGSNGEEDNKKNEGDNGVSNDDALFAPRVATAGNGRPCKKCTKTGEKCEWIPSRRLGKAKKCSGEAATAPGRAKKLPLGERTANGEENALAGFISAKQLHLLGGSSGGNSNVTSPNSSSSGRASRSNSSKQSNQTSRIFGGSPEMFCSSISEPNIFAQLNLSPGPFPINWPHQFSTSFPRTGMDPKSSPEFLPSLPSSPAPISATAYLNSLGPFDLPDVPSSMEALISLCEVPEALDNTQWVDYVCGKTEIGVGYESASPHGPQNVLFRNKEDSVEVFALVEIFLEHVAHLCQLYFDPSKFRRNNFFMASPTLIAAMCAMAQPFHHHLYPHQPLSRDYIALADTFMDTPDPTAYTPLEDVPPEGLNPPPIERIIAHLILVSLSYGFNRPHRARELLYEAASLGLHWELFSGNFDKALGGPLQDHLYSVDGYSGNEFQTSRWDDEMGRQVWASTVSLDMHLLFAINANQYGSVLEGRLPTEVKTAWPRSWLDYSSTDEQTARAVLHARSFPTSIPIFPPLPPDTPRRDEMVQFFDLTFGNFIKVCEAAHHRASDDYHRTGDRKDRIRRENTFSTFTDLTASRIHLHHRYAMSEVDLQFDSCSLQPTPKDFEPNSPSLKSLTVSNGSIKPCSGKMKRKREDEEITGVHLVSGGAIGSLSIMVASGQAGLALDRANVKTNQALAGAQLTRPTTGTMAPELSDIELEGAKFHDPFYCCKSMVGAFAILLGIASIHSSLERYISIRKKPVDHGSTSYSITGEENDDVSLPSPPRLNKQDEAMVSSAQRRIKGLLSELDILHELLMEQGQVWPLARSRANKLVDCREKVMAGVDKTFEAVGFLNVGNSTFQF